MKHEKDISNYNAYLSLGMAALCAFVAAVLLMPIEGVVIRAWLILAAGIINIIGVVFTPGGDRKYRAASILLSLAAVYLALFLFATL